MKDIDVDAVVALEKELRRQSPVDRQDAIAKLVEAVREAGVHLTSENAVSLDAEEQKAMNHLIAALNVIGAWRFANGPELTAATHVIQGFIIAHMLHRLNPDKWPDWSRHQPEPVTSL